MTMRRNARPCYVIAYAVGAKFVHTPTTIVSDFLVDMHRMACIVVPASDRSNENHGVQLRYAGPVRCV